jgi:hypothetical protein
MSSVRALRGSARLLALGTLAGSMALAVSTAIPASAALAHSAAPARSAASHNPRTIAKAMLGRFGWQPRQFTYLDKLWSHESGWRVTATNPSSGAYGIPQSLPGSKMASAGRDWRTNPATQIKWGLTYIHDRYGSPSRAWAHELSHNWY